MTGLLDLSPRSPAPIGLTTKNYRLASLHGDRLRQPREPSPSILAPPKGSSSDEESNGQEVPGDGLSDDSEFGRSDKKKEIDRSGMLRTGIDSNAAKGEDSYKRELSVEPSNIRPSSFTSGKGPGSRNGSQSSQKRNNIDVDDDEVSIAFSQPKKSRQSYGSTNVHRVPGKPNKVLLKEGKKAGPAFKNPSTEAMIAQGRRSLRVSLLKRTRLTSSS